MTLEVLQKEMIEAMKNHNKDRKETISSLVSAVKKTAIDNQCKDNITEELVNNVILKEKKTMQEMIDTCPTDRTEVLMGYRAKMSVIDEFAPVLLTDKSAIADTISRITMENGIDLTKQNKGQVMKVVMPVMKGKADMKIVNEVIGELLK